MRQTQPNYAATPAEIQQVEDLHAAGLDADGIARALRIRKGNVLEVLMAAEARRKQTIQDKLKVDFGSPWTLQLESAMITADWHVPETDWRMVEKMLTIAGKHLYKPRQLIIGGDYFSQSQFSPFAAVVPPAPWAQERDAAREIMLACLDVFAEIWIVMGNHDQRLVKWSQAILDESDVFGMVIQNPKVHISKFAYCTIETSRGKYRVTHPAFYRQARGMAVAALADRLQMHVFGGHQHHTAISASPSGKFWGIDIGGLYDPDKIAYVNLADNLRPAMSPSFGMLLDGYPYVFANGLTDWGKWGC
jgi:hypothetical protein